MKIKTDLFDLYRGLAAVMVYFHHCAILGGGPSFIANGRVGVFAVDIFMLTSGFLMAFQGTHSRAYQGLTTTSGITIFYLRRFFRLSPLYYVILTLALVLAADLGRSRETLAALSPEVHPDSARYFIDDPIRSFLLHITYVFGLWPATAFSTPLPDWTLSLEMQFYALFPPIFFLCRRNALVVLSLLGGAMVIVAYALHFAGLRYPALQFPMPAFLPLKFHNFAAGILLFLALNNPAKARGLILCAVILVTLGERSPLMPALVLFSMAVLSPPIGSGLVTQARGWVNAIASSRAAKFFADVSYSLYLLHLLFVLPYFAWISQQPQLGLHRGVAIWLGESVALLVPLLLLAYGTYRVIEKPGIALGKRLAENSKPPGTEVAATK